MSWIEPLRHDPRARRDLDKYLEGTPTCPKKTQLLEWAEQQRAFTGSVLVVWAREDKLMPPEHAERLAAHFENAELIWIDDSARSSRSTSPKLSSATSNVSSHEPQQLNGDRVDATSFEIMRRERITEALASDGDFSAAGFIEVRP